MLRFIVGFVLTAAVLFVLSTCSLVFSIALAVSFEQVFFSSVLVFCVLILGGILFAGFTS